MWTRPRAAAAVKNPGLEEAFRGQVIDKAVKDAVLNDPELEHLFVAGQGLYGPDITDLQSGTWWDVTTPAQFQDHLDLYGNLGSGIGPFTK